MEEGVAECQSYYTQRNVKNDLYVINLSVNNTCTVLTNALADH